MESAANQNTGHNWQERKLGRLTVYRSTVDIDDVVPNENQPRLGSKEILKLQAAVEARTVFSNPFCSNHIPTLSRSIVSSMETSLDEF